jgi:hypothetical protein
MFVTVYNPTETPQGVNAKTGATVPGLSWAGGVDPDDPVVKAGGEGGRLHVYRQPLDAGPGQNPEAVAAVKVTAEANTAVPAVPAVPAADPTPISAPTAQEAS